MTTIKPYLIRAVYEWVVDNNYTPYINVDTTNSLVEVPKEYVENDSITLDLSPESTDELLIENEVITCQARFAGKVHNLYIPILSVVAIYAQENNQGMAFPKEDEINGSEQHLSPPPTKKSKTKKLNLKVISGDKDQTQN